MNLDELIAWITAQAAISAEMRDTLVAVVQELQATRADLREIIDVARLNQHYSADDGIDWACDVALAGLERGATYDGK